MRLQDEHEHPHGLSARDFDTVFTTDRPVIFAYHGYPWLIHRLTYRRTNHDNIHVRGYKEEGTTTTPFDMVMMNDLDRYHLVMDVIDRVPSLGSRAAALRQEMGDTRTPGPGVDPRARRGPARGARLVRGPAEPTRQPSRSRTCRAIASSSSVGTTSTSTGEPSALTRRGTVGVGAVAGRVDLDPERGQPAAARPRAPGARARPHRR